MKRESNAFQKFSNFILPLFVHYTTLNIVYLKVLVAQRHCIMQSLGQTQGKALHNSLCISISS